MTVRILCALPCITGCVQVVSILQRSSQKSKNSMDVTLAIRYEVNSNATTVVMAITIFLVITIMYTITQLSIYVARRSKWFQYR